MRSRFMLIPGNEECRSVLSVATVLLFSRLSSHKNIDGTEYVLSQYRECTLEPVEVKEELCCTCMKWGTTDDEEQSFFIVK